MKSFLRRIALMLSASALVVAGLAVPADAATHTTYVSDTGTYGTKITAKVTSRDVNLNTLGGVIRVDVALYTRGDVAVDPDNIAIVAARNGYEYAAGDLVEVGENRFVAEFQADPLVTPGVYDIGVWITATGYASGGTDWLEIYDESVTSITLKRATQLRVSASPNPVSVGKPLVVSGTLKKLGTVDGYTATYVPAAGARVGLFFDPAGSKPQVYKGSVTVNSQGKFSKTFTASGPGVWRAKFPGTTSTYLAPSGANVSVSTR